MTFVGCLRAFFQRGVALPFYAAEFGSGRDTGMGKPHQHPPRLHHWSRHFLHHDFSLTNEDLFHRQTPRVSMIFLPSKALRSTS